MNSLKVLFFWVIFNSVSASNKNNDYYGQVIKDFGFESALIDIKPYNNSNPNDNSDCFLATCFFGINNFCTLLSNLDNENKNMNQIIDNFFNNKANINQLFITRNINQQKKQRMPNLSLYNAKNFLNILTNEEGIKGFFNQSDTVNLKNTIIDISNITYEYFVRHCNILCFNTKNKLQFSNKKVNLSYFFQANSITTHVWRFYLIDNEDNILGTIGLQPYTIAAPETISNKGRIIQKNRKISSNKTFIADYFILSQFRGKGFGRIILLKMIEMVFTPLADIDYIILNIRPNNIASLKMAYKTGFKSLQELFFEKKKTKSMDYILTKDFYSKNKEEIISGTLNENILSKDIYNLINKKRKLSNTHIKKEKHKKKKTKTKNIPQKEQQIENHHFEPMKLRNGTCIPMLTH